MKDKRLISPTSSSGFYYITIDGWHKIKELETGNPNTNVAFMAMEYNDKMKSIFYNYFKLAVAETNFDLRILDENPEAGLIDNRLRAEIRKSIFLIADISDKNGGAYWEGGFAEGLGKKVIYTCKKSIIESNDPEIRPHFDINHSLFVPWEDTETELFDAMIQLKATIRNSLPDKARAFDQEGDKFIKHSAT